MRVVVVGAGIIGVCTAWYLRQLGFEVTVLERRDAVARETSWGNAGIIAPGYVTPWAAPGMPRKIASYLLAAESPVLLRPVASRALWRWLRGWLRECELERYRVNKSRMQRLAFYSRDELHRLRDRLSLRYAQRRGYLQLLRSERDVALAAPARALLDEGGVPHRLIDAAEARTLEPALAPATPLAGALYLPDDESGSCPDFAQGLADACRAGGVAFEFGRAVRRIVAAGGRVSGVDTDAGLRCCEAVVVAAACDSLPLIAPHGLRPPVWPVKGYSMTATMPDPARGPRHGMIDEAYKVALTPFGDRLRVAGTAEIGSAELRPRPAAFRTLAKVAADWFPHAARFEHAERWVGARPMLPDGPPLLGATPVRGLFLNLGHGSTGWAMACGSGRIVADVVAGRAPEIDLDGLTIERLATGMAPPSPAEVHP